MRPQLLVQLEAAVDALHKTETARAAERPALDPCANKQKITGEWGYQDVSLSEDLSFAMNRSAKLHCPNNEIDHREQHDAWPPTKTSYDMRRRSCSSPCPMSNVGIQTMCVYTCFTAFCCCAPTGGFPYGLVVEKYVPYLERAGVLFRLINTPPTVEHPPPRVPNSKATTLRRREKPSPCFIGLHLLNRINENIALAVLLIICSS